MRSNNHPPSPIPHPPSIKKGALILSIAGVLSHLLGVGRDITLSHFFGAGLETDAYGTAFLFPDLIFNLLIGSTLMGVFLPVFSKEFSKDKKEAEKISGAFLSFMTIFTFSVCILTYFFIPQIIKIFYSNFSPEKMTLTVNLSRILLASPLLFLFGNFLGSILLSQKYFFSYAFSPVLYNLGIILGIFFFHNSAGIYSASYGVLIGLFFYVLLRIFDFSGLKFLPKLNLDFSKTKKIFILAFPRALGLFLFHINLWTYSFFSASLEEGSFAAFNFARNIETFPVSIFGVAVATAALPFLSDLNTKKGKNKKAAEIIEKSAKQILFFSIPAFIGIACLSENIVDVVLKHGEFSENAFKMTSGILFFLALSIPLESLGHLFSQAFYAFQNTLLPLLSSLLLTSTNVVLSLILVKSLGSFSFGISLSVGILVKVLLLGFLLKRKINFSVKNIFRSGIKMLLVGIFMGVVLILIKNTFSNPLDLYSKIIFLIALVSVGALVYLGLIKFLLKKD